MTSFYFEFFNWIFLIKYFYYNVVLKTKNFDFKFYKFYNIYRTEREICDYGIRCLFYLHNINCDDAYFIISQHWKNKIVK